MSEYEFVRLTVLLGSVEPKSFYRLENGRAVCYSYAITRDQQGLEIGRTKPEALSSIGWDNGDAFTTSDLKELEYE